jgi:hypothetical protein
MATGENIYGEYGEYRRAYSAEVTTPEDLEWRVDELGETLSQLKEHESYLPCREWLEDAERWHRRLKTSLEDYRMERDALQRRMARAQQVANEAARESVTRNLHAHYESFQESVKTGGQTIAVRFRKSWEGWTRAFNRAFTRDEELDPKPRS